MTKSKVLFRAAGIAALSLAILSLSVCSSGGDDSSTPATPPLVTSEADTVNAVVVTAVYSAVSNAIAYGSSAMVPKGAPSVLPATVSYSGTGYSASGSYTMSESAYDYNITVTFNGYTYDQVVIKSGSAVYYIDGSFTAFTGKYTGNFVVTYKGADYTFGWNISYSYSQSAYSYSGTYTINGYTYTYTHTS